MRTVSAFSMQHKVSAQYAALTRQIGQDRVQRAVVGGLGFGSAQASMFLTYALIFWYGATLIKSGEISFLQLMIASLSLMLGALGLGAALADIGDQKLGIETAARIFKSIDAGVTSPIDGLSVAGKTPAGRATGRIVLKDVKFRYPTRPDVQVCRNLNLTIEPGEMVAFVGPSGSGKSTVINLLLRFYDPLSGSVALDGVDIRELNVRWLRAQIGYVGQEPVLFTGSVGENIAKGRIGSLDQPVTALADAMKASDAGESSHCGSWCRAGQTGGHQPVASDDRSSDAEAKGDLEMSQSSAKEDIVEAAIASNAHDFIKTFPQGYDTDIGEGSIMVSGGQKQRIAIARALIKKPAILLLDEATSALDVASERIVQESIDALQQRKEQTTIIIAHRLSTIRSADKIVVIDKGAVVEVGKHDDLLAGGGLYATLWAKQAGGPTSPVRAAASP
jgi:ATP-binding cassette subfamily B (MDR/TAP) protein 1